MLSVGLPNQIADLLPIDGAAVRHGEQDALNFQFQVYLPPYFLHCLKQLLQPFCRKILCLHRNQCGICRCQRIDRQHTERGSAVNQNIVVLAFCAFQHLFHHFLPAHGIHQSHFQSGQFDVGRDKVNALRMVQNPFAGWNTLVVHGFLHKSGECSGQCIRVLPAHTDSKRTLWVSVHKQNFLALHCKPYAQIFTGGGFARAAFLVDNGYRCCLFGNFHHLRAAKSWLTLF